MSRLALCSIFVVLCAIEYVCAQQQWEDLYNSQKGQKTEKDIPFVILGRQLRSPRARKPDAKTLKTLRKSTQITPQPCECSGPGCTCCGTFTFDGKTDKACSSFEIPTSRSRKQMVRYNFNYNDFNTQAAAPTGSDPKGMCQPYPGYRNTYVCSRYHSTKVENGKVRFCLTMEAKYQGFTFYQMDFDCVTYDVEKQQQVEN